LELPPRHAYGFPVVGGQDPVALTVALVVPAGAVDGVSVELDDHTLLLPDAIRLVCAAAGLDELVHPRKGKVGTFKEGDEEVLELFLGHRGAALLVGQNGSKRGHPSVTGVAVDQVGQ